MTVNYEIKGMLAKLLATEDILVEHKKVDTACFNVHTRVLTLPMWKASNTVVDLLVAHEVGHSRETPDIDWTDNYKIPPQFVNVCEDVRIEKLIKRRYAGLAKTFFNGYKELSEQDFFQIGNDNLETYNLADRVNLYFKIGNFIDIPIQSGEETDIVTQIADAETFDEVLIAAEVLYKYCIKNNKEQIEDSNNNAKLENNNSNSGSSSDSNNYQNGENVQSESNDSKEESSNKKTQEDLNGLHSNKTVDKSGNNRDKKLEVKTMESLENALKNLVDNNSFESVYVEIPKLDLNTIIISNSEIHSNCATTWNNCKTSWNNCNLDIFCEVDNKFVDFKNSAQREVNYLVKEFECKKAANSYARSTISRTGILDCSKLHNYKFSEDLFKKVTTIADGKNHGLIFILDWSGSMRDVMIDTVKQLFNLVWFCKKLSIPFEVYAFTNEYPTHKNSSTKNIELTTHTKKNGVFAVGEWFSLMNIISSKVNNKTLDIQMKNIFRLAYSFSKYNYVLYSTPLGLGLSGTPLNEAIIALHQILPKFKKENKLQKVQCIILTDGEACPLKYYREINRKWESGPYIGTNYVNENCIFRDRKTGNTYKLNSDWSALTDVLLLNLRDNFTDINFIGIRVLDNKDSGSFIRKYYGYENSGYNKIINSWKKQKSFSIKTSGYHTYFGISSTILCKESEFNVSDDASKTQIKSAFVKSLKTKKMNKKILNEFIELIA